MRRDAASASTSKTQFQAEAVLRVGRQCQCSQWRYCCTVQVRRKAPRSVVRRSSVSFIDAPITTVRATMYRPRLDLCKLSSMSPYWNLEHQLYMARLMQTGETEKYCACLHGWLLLTADDECIGLSESLHDLVRLHMHSVGVPCCCCCQGEHNLLHIVPAGQALQVIGVGDRASFAAHNHQV